jgi:NADP-reducing hydrogenase subunit HndC
LNLPFKTHVLICTGPRCGDERNSNRVRQEFRKEFVRQSVMTGVKETRCICFGLCSVGPNVIIYPDGIVYSGVRPQDVRDIVRDHLRGGRVVERLLYEKKETVTPPGEPEFDPLPEGT